MTTQRRAKAPFIMIPQRIAFDTSLSGKAQVLSGVLLSHAGGKEGCWYKRKTLADEMGCSERTLDGYIRELVPFGLKFYRHKYQNRYVVSGLWGDGTCQVV